MSLVKLICKLSDHKFVLIGTENNYNVYRCERCGEIRKIPIKLPKRR